MVPDEEVQGTQALDEDGFPLSPLREQDELWFIQAAELYRPLARCARTARASGMLMILSGVLALAAGGLTMHVVTLVIGLILVTLGAIERSAAGDVARAELKAPGRLALNQLMLFGLVVLYCGAQMKSFHTAFAKSGTVTEVANQLSSIPAELDPLRQELLAMLPELEPVLPKLIFGFFGLMAALSLVFQGYLAAYYATRKNKVRTFHRELPPWVSNLVTLVSSR